MKKYKRGNRVLKLTFMGIIGVAMLSGCGKSVDCDISEPHLHEYVNDDGYLSYVDSEKIPHKGLRRLEGSLIVDEEEVKLRDFEEKEGLYRIFENTEVIDREFINSRDFIEYRYSYNYLQPIPQVITNGKTTTVTFIYAPATGYSWTSDSTHPNLTGESRIIHKVYQGFKIEKDKRGKYVAIGSEYFDSVDEFPSEYKYIKEKFYKQIDVKTGEFDYEDGPEESHQLPDEIEQGYEESKRTK